jgi:hypothetical protein
MTIGDRSLVESGVILEFLETEFCRSVAQPFSVSQHLSASQPASVSLTSALAVC